MLVQPYMIKDWNGFSTQIEELNLYMIEFNKDGAMKAKEYFINGVVDVNKCQPIVVIIHNKYTFSTNNRVQRV